MSFLQRAGTFMMAVYKHEPLHERDLPYMQRLVLDALRLAEEVHEQQRYGHEPYVNHVFDAANLARHMGYNAQTVIALLLHDTVEDTSMTLDRLRNAGMPPSVIAAVDDVTFNDEVDNPNDLTGEARRQLKLAKAKRTPVGHVSKFCDSSVNFGHTVSYPWMLRWDNKSPRVYALDYTPNLADLAEQLPTPRQVKAYTDEVDQEWCIERYLGKNGLGEHGLCGWNGKDLTPWIHDEAPDSYDSRWTRVEKRVARERHQLARRNHCLIDPVYCHQD